MHNDANVWSVNIVRLFIFLICFGIVIWQCWSCVTKFLDKPQGTSMKIVRSAEKLYPSITFCPDFKDSWNVSVLSDCGISINQYTTGSTWSNQDIEKCSDPKTLQENMIVGSEGIIRNVRIDFNDNSDTNFIGDNLTNILKPIGFHRGGRQKFLRCYKYQYPAVVQTKGISTLKMFFKGGLILKSSNI